MSVAVACSTEDILFGTSFVQKNVNDLMVCSAVIRL